MFQSGDNELEYLRYLLGDSTLGEGIEGPMDWYFYFEFVRGDF